MACSEEEALTAAQGHAEGMVGRAHERSGSLQQHILKLKEEQKAARDRRKVVQKERRNEELRKRRLEPSESPRERWLARRHSHAPERTDVNGRDIEVAVPDRKLLSDTLREELGLTGTKVGCEAGDCGACTVLLDGAQVCACLVPPNIHLPLPLPGGPR